MPSFVLVWAAAVNGVHSKCATVIGTNRELHEPYMLCVWPTVNQGQGANVTMCLCVCSRLMTRLDWCAVHCECECCSVQHEWHWTASASGSAQMFRLQPLLSLHFSTIYRFEHGNSIRTSRRRVASACCAADYYRVPCSCVRQLNFSLRYCVTFCCTFYHSFSGIQFVLFLSVRRNEVAVLLFNP